MARGHDVNPDRSLLAMLPRRHALLGLAALPLLQGCSAPLAEMSATASTKAGAGLLHESALAHGGAALAGVRDISVGYQGEWRPFMNRMQPALVDAGFRGGSQERLLLRDGLIGQVHEGPDGHKQVLRRDGQAPGDLRVMFNGAEATDRPRRDAAALVADAYRLFLLGPMLLDALPPGRIIVEDGGTEDIVAGDERRVCDVLRVRLAPGLGFAPSDRLEVLIARDDRLMRRVRFTLDGLETTQGALAEVDTWRHVTVGGIRFPTRFHEQLLRPLPLPVHDWQLTGIDLDRGLQPGDVAIGGFSGPAIRLALAIG
eukprot:gene9355-9435_t